MKRFLSVPLLISILCLFTGAYLTSSSSQDPNKGDPDYMWKLTLEDPIEGQLSWIEMKMDAFVFTGKKFPQASFKKPELVKQALGDYELNVKYYNADFKPVDSASTAGRYGAVVNIKFASGLKLSRYYTLFRYPEQLKGEEWWKWAARDKQQVNLELPPVLGISTAVSHKYANEISSYVRFGFYEDFFERSYSSRLLAGLFEISNLGDKMADAEDNVINRDRQWWVTMKHILNPSVPETAKDFKGPQILSSPVSPVLRTTTPDAAHMLPGTKEEIDKVLNHWAANSDEAFGVEIAHEGKVFFQKAYGQRDGKALEVNDMSHAASINKTFTGILLMMCVDRGYLSLDDNITKYLPSLKDVKFSQPLTIRHLVTHTSGLPNLMLDEANDLEEIIKPFLPNLRVGGNWPPTGDEWAYCETGYSLCGKIMENITGKCYATLLKEWLLKPMKMEHTEVVGAASDAWSTPDDLAKIGQLILNKGAYGNVRYFSETTMKQMMPTIENIQGVGLMRGLAGTVPTACRRGISNSIPLTPEAQEQQEKKREDLTMGYGFMVMHPASSYSLFAIDVENQLVIIMTRNRQGTNFKSNHRAFMKSIIQHVNKGGLDMRELAHTDE